jgi:hypothetical protein
MIDPKVKTKIEELVDVLGEAYGDLCGIEIEFENELDKETGLKNGFDTIKKVTLLYITREELKLK